MSFFRKLKYAFNNFWASFKAGDTLTEHLTADKIKLILDTEAATNCPCCHRLNWSLDTAIHYLRTRNIDYGKPIYTLRCMSCNFIMIKPFIAIGQTMTRERTHSFVKSVKRKKFKPYLVKESKPTSE